ncbi:YtxH domain-containing protein [Pedobacter psychroterrae]|uniref:YtxH domain-containing protein n=2 Tax=Pedobacter psychroterrae TaxID=2530453 RepID=A0A4R0NV52_9SPHI|nr:YtxH domain-containing protein [Pedobacter psychroterrae]
MANIFAHNTKNNTTVAFAVIAGLAVGAVLGVLFAPESGADVRKNVRNRITGSDPSEQSFAEQREQPLTHAPAKRPKSDIKELIHEAHVNGIHTEQSLN